MTGGDDLRNELCAIGQHLAAAGMARGGSGNISVRLASGEIAISPTGASLGDLRPEALAILAPDGGHRRGGAPSKEWPLHLALYAERPQAGAVVHLHSPYATAWSILEGLDAEDALPAITPYAVMRLGRVALIPFAVPGDSGLGGAITARAGAHSAFLLANHGSVVSARSIGGALYAAEELEETARLALLLEGRPIRRLTPTQIAEIEATWGDRYR